MIDSCNALAWHGRAWLGMFDMCVYYNVCEQYLIPPSLLHLTTVFQYQPGLTGLPTKLSYLKFKYLGSAETNLLIQGGELVWSFPWQQSSLVFYQLIYKLIMLIKCIYKSLVLRQYNKCPHDIYQSNIQSTMSSALTGDVLLRPNVILLSVILPNAVFRC